LEIHHDLKVQCREEIYRNSKKEDRQRMGKQAGSDRQGKKRTSMFKKTPNWRWKARLARAEMPH